MLPLGLAFKQTKLATWVAEKWVKLVGIILLVVAVAATYGLTYYAGRHAVELEVAEERAAEAKKLAELLEADMVARQPVIEKADARRNELVYSNQQTLRKLDEAIKAAGRKPSCDLSDDEFRLLNEIGKD